MKATRLAPLAAALALLGCATTPVPTASALSVPRERVLRAEFLQYRSDYGQVVVKRDEGWTGSACNTRVYANGVPVAG